MRFIIVFATFFSVCCGFSVLNIFPIEISGQKFHLVKRTQVNGILTDEEILRCQNSTNKICEDLIQRSNQKELQDLLSKRISLLQQNTTLLSGNDNNDLDRSSPSEDQNDQEHELLTNVDSTAEKSEEFNDENIGENEISSETSERSGRDVHSSEPLSDEYDDLMEATTTTEKFLKPTTESSDFWSFFFRNTGSSNSSSPAFVSNQDEVYSTEKPLDKSEITKAVFYAIILRPINTKWNLSSYIFGVRDPRDSSKENRSVEHLQGNETKESVFDFENSTDLEYSKTEIVTPWNLVMPGTKWCGAGSIATHDDDLGYFEDVDRCCRTHDKCDDLMIPGESKYNLTNTSAFTVLNCNCDDELYECLSRINSVASNTVGNTFFNIFSRMCYMLDYPRTCKKHYSMLGCQEYEIDYSAEKVYQWKPAKKYLKMPFTISG